MVGKKRRIGKRGKKNQLINNVLMGVDRRKTWPGIYEHCR